MPVGGGHALYRELLGIAGELELGHVGEKQLLGVYLLPLCRAACGDHGLGDDGAAVSMPRGWDAVVSCDRVPTDLIATQIGLMSLEQLGRYLVRVNVSDLAAMAADPVGMLVSAAFPATTPLRHVLELMWGCYDESARFSCPVLGGDTKSALERSITATVLGACPPGRQLRRAPLRTGDTVCVTGPVGTVNAALRWFAAERASRDAVAEPPATVARELRRSLLGPVPRIDLVSHIRDCPQVVAGMDITDGLGSSLREFAAASSLGVAVDEDRLPISPAARWVADVLHLRVSELVGGIGNDLELLIAVRGEFDLPFVVHPIGEVTSDPSVKLRSGSGSDDVFPVSGFEHFQRPALEHVAARPSEMDRADRRYPCKLCDWLATQVANATEGDAVSVDDRYPVSPGHLLVLPRRHEPDFFRLAPEEQHAIWRLVARERERLGADHGTEHFTIGINAGAGAGQTVDHAHVHVIPRFPGDVENPCGGVRGVIPSKRTY